LHGLYKSAANWNNNILFHTDTGSLYLIPGQDSRERSQGTDPRNGSREQIQGTDPGRIDRTRSREHIDKPCHFYLSTRAGGKWVGIILQLHNISFYFYFWSIYLLLMLFIIFLPSWRITSLVYLKFYLMISANVIIRTVYSLQCIVYIDEVIRILFFAHVLAQFGPRISFFVSICVDRTQLV